MKPLFFLLLLYLSGCAQNDELAAAGPGNASAADTLSATSVVLVPNLGLVFHDSLPFTGTTAAYYPNGQLAAAINYTDGKKDGFYRKWFSDGQLSFAAGYVSGKQHGESKSWWRNGHLRSLSRFEHGVATGLQQQWYVSGAKFKEMRLVDGREEGMQRSWRENGKLYNNYEARDGRIFGLKRANLCYALEDEQVVLTE